MTRGLQNERFGLFAQLYLGFVVLLQIEIAKLFVDFYKVIEILYIKIIGLPEIL